MKKDLGINAGHAPKRARASASRPLTAKEERFVLEYLIDLNASAAARRAGYSVKNSDVVGARMLVKVGVAAAIEKAKAERNERTLIDVDWAVQRLAAIVDLDPRDLYVWGDDVPGFLKIRNMDEMKPETRRLITGLAIEFEGGGKDPVERVIRLGLLDKKWALEQILLHTGAVAPKGAAKLEVSTPDVNPLFPQIPLAVLQQVVVRYEEARKLHGDG